MLFDPELVVPDQDLSLEEGAIVPWQGPYFSFYRQALESVGFSIHPNPTEAMQIHCDLKTEETENARQAS